MFLIFQSRVSKLNEQLESEKLDLLSVVERKSQEIDRLNGERKMICIQYIVPNKIKHVLNLQCVGKNCFFVFFFIIIVKCDFTELTRRRIKFVGAYIGI